MGTPSHEQASARKMDGFAHATGLTMNTRFGWDVGEGRQSDSAVERIAERKEVAERPSQAPNGSAARLRDSLSRDERAWREVTGPERN